MKALIITPLLLLAVTRPGDMLVVAGVVVGGSLALHWLLGRR